MCMLQSNVSRITHHEKYRASAWHVHKFNVTPLKQYKAQEPELNISSLVMQS